MSYSTPYAWMKPRDAARIAQEKQERESIMRLCVDTLYEVILKCDDPAVRWEAARLLQQIGPLKERLQ
ncbi:hypothetical protein OPU71_04330 [Niveibacterium sp. 24ML]|uniref:hypothetical protein n=1 Tax=Niveibacterium sp. 24ML TaxID=2985512 RepID=UPI00226EDEDF|nr:hypothetical protein [Niveibacterium sp. 24ML]MCX9155344.1 hypothetical protein [Niveibacterium sp. 24ML]